ncbi:MAG: TonB-dependent receptor [Halioglobus sp.]|nr:TonB-dependent receptor [Halioglobus sp.]
MRTRPSHPPSALTALVAAISLANTAQAQERQDAPKLEEVVVWATQVRASSVELGEEAFSIKQADHLSDLLRTIPGVDVGGAHSLNQRITIRSLGDRDLRVSIDGANQNTYMYHHMGNLQIHADILQAVDIDVGTNSVIHGGLGGSVRFETKDARHLLNEGERFGMRLQGTYGDNTGSGYSATAFGQITDTIDALAYYHHLDRDNYKVGGGEIQDSNGQEIPGTDGQVKGLKGNLDDTLVKVGWDLTENQRLQLSYEYYKDAGDYSYRPDMGLATDIAIGDSLGLPLTFDTRFERDTLTLNYELQWGANSTLHAALFGNKSTLSRDESAINALWPEDPAYVEGKAENTGFNALAVTTLGDGVTHELTYGVDIIDYNTEYKPDGSVLSKEQATNSAIFLQDRIDLNHALALIPGVRYDYYDIDSTVLDGDFDAISGALAGEWSVSDNLLVKLSGTQIFQVPEIAEVFTGAGLYDTPNPDIDNESGYNAELSVAFNDRMLGADRFSAGFTLFYTDIQDYIYEYAPVPESVGSGYWQDNVGDMRIDGVESYIGYDLGALRTLLTYSLSDSDLSSNNDYTSLDGARLDREQGDTYSLNIDYLIEAYHLALHTDVLWVESLGSGLDLDGASLDNSKDGFTVVNISARWSPAQVAGLSLTVGVDNLLDEYYASQSSRTGLSSHPRFGELQLTDYEPGRNFKATVSYEF